MLISDHLQKLDPELSSGIILVSGMVAFCVRESSWENMSFWDQVLRLPMTATSQVGAVAGKRYWLGEELELGGVVLYSLVL